MTGNNSTDSERSTSETQRGISEVPEKKPVKHDPYEIPQNVLPKEVAKKLKPGNRLIVHSSYEKDQETGQYTGFNSYSVYDKDDKLVFDFEEETLDLIKEPQEENRSITPESRGTQPIAMVTKRPKNRTKPSPTSSEKPARPIKPAEPAPEWNIDEAERKFEDRLRDKRDPWKNPGSLGSKIEDVKKRMPEGKVKDQILQNYEFQIEKYKKDMKRVLNRIKNNRRAYEKEVRNSVKFIPVEGIEELLNERADPVQLYVDLWWHVRIYVDPLEVNGIYDIWKVQPPIIQYLWNEKELGNATQVSKPGVFDSVDESIKDIFR